MSISVYVGHSGQQLIVDSRTTSTLDALRNRVAEDAGIHPRNQVLLTASGKQAKVQALLTESELFVFDANLLNSAGNAKPPEASIAQRPDHFDAGQPPRNVNGAQDDLQAWQDLFEARQSWANGLLAGCRALAQEAERWQEEQIVIERCLGVAVTSLQRHVGTAQQKHEEVRQWSQEALEEQNMYLEHWEQNLDSLRHIPARQEFARFLQSMSDNTTRRLSQQSGVSTLQSFVDLPTIKKAAGSAKRLTNGLSQTITDLNKRIDETARDTEDLMHAIEQMNELSQTDSASGPVSLLEEITVVVKKISSDFEHVRSLPRNAHSLSQASKMASLHSRNYLPNLSEYSTEMNNLAVRSQESRNNSADLSIEHMRTLSSTESHLASIFSKLKQLDLPEDEQQAFSKLAVSSRLPSVYGQLLVESVRRREWVAKMKRDSATLQEEVAMYQEEEEKRRRKWMRSVEDLVDPNALLATKALGIELSLQNEGGSWPTVTRQELQDYLDALLEVYGDGPVVAEFDQSVKDLDKPTKKQIKHARAFKHGSMHEAAFGDTSLFLRGDEQGKSFREANARLEEEVKAQKSRVRKLEDLLHRQSALNRNSNDIFTPSQERVGTPPAVPGSGSNTAVPSGGSSRDGSFRHRRLSSTAQQMEEKKLARRVVDLEAELQAAKKHASSLEQEATVRRDSDAETQKQVDEALSTKRDLMENMEAQQREFADERRNLEIELRKAKEHVEELEDELERMAGSRDHERTGSDERLKLLEKEVVRLKEDAAGHAARAATAQDARHALERKLENIEKARSDLDAQLKASRNEQVIRDEAEAEHTEKFVAALTHLDPDALAPNGLAGLSAALEELARRSAAHSNDLKEAVAFAKSENDSLRAANDTQKNDLSSASQREIQMEAELRQAQELHATEQAKTLSLEQQLKNEQEQLRTLRDKFAEGETGSEVLRQRLDEGEVRAGKLSQKLAEVQSHANSLDVELMRLQRKHESYHRSAEAAEERLQRRAERAKDVSQRLYAQNTRLSRLLERIGLAVTYSEDGSMTVERASKLGASVLTDPHSSFSRTVSLTSPPPTRKSSTSEEPLTLSGLHWPDAQSADDEAAQFDAYLQQVARFNVDSFAEAIVKRLRDFEYTAKKYNREAKDAAKRADAYKERFSRIRGEAHAKIAVKDFKEGDLALFLPTRGQAKGAWAAFNIGCPHYFLAEREGMRLGSRDFIVARISKVEQRVVDLSKTMPQDNRSIDERSDALSYDEDNPFELSDGLTWWLVHASEERGAGAAPTTPGLGKSTVAAANVDAKGSIRMKRSSKTDGASQHLNKSLDSRRSSSTSKKGAPGIVTAVSTTATANGSPIARSRSQSQTSLKPPPALAGSSPVTNNTSHNASGGLGIISDTSDRDGAQQSGDQVHIINNDSKDNSMKHPFPISSNMSAPHAQGAASPLSKEPRHRSASPSKSTRSLQRHLDRSASPPKPSPAKKDKPGIWNSLWQAEFKVESPSKSSR